MSISFDRAADFYDETRGYPPDVQERIGKALLDAAGAKPMHAEAGRAELAFNAQNELKHVHAEENVKLWQHAPVTSVTQRPQSTRAAAAPAMQNVELTAQTLDADLRGGNTITQATTSGGSVLTLPEGSIRAPRLDATFTANNRPRTLHATDGTTLVSEGRTTTSRDLNATFDAQGRVASMQQMGDFHYEEGTRRATADGHLVGLRRRTCWAGPGRNARVRAPQRLARRARVVDPAP